MVENHHWIHFYMWSPNSNAYNLYTVGKERTYFQLLIENWKGTFLKSVYFFCQKLSRYEKMT